MWTEMGDYLSRQYSGTDSTIARVSRDGKEGFMGKLSHNVQSVNRFLKNTLNENGMQEAIETVLGKHDNTGYSSDLRKFLQKGLAEQALSYTTAEQMQMAVCTWNLSGVKPYENVDLTEWLMPKFRGSAPPHLFVIGF